MPRCIDVVCRNDIVERAKAGDKVVFTGTIVVVPDTNGLASVGESTVSGRSGTSRGSEHDGFHGLKRLGCKEMTYKVCHLFLFSLYLSHPLSHPLSLILSLILTPLRSLLSSTILLSRILTHHPLPRR